MIVRNALLCAGVAISASGLAGTAAARGDFAPSVRFSPSSRRAGANPRLAVRIAQRAGEEPIERITFHIPRGFGFPRDAAIADGEVLGHGEFTTATAPFCDTAFQQTFGATGRERDRTAQEVRAGVWSVWVVDLGAVKVDLVFTRTGSGAWRAVADIPTTPILCAPDALTARLNRTSARSHAKLWRNPRRPGVYTLTSVLESAKGSRHVVRQRIAFTR